MGIEFPPSALRAATAVALPDPFGTLCRLCDRFAEFGRVSREGCRAAIETGHGCAFLCAENGALRLEAGGSDPTNLSFVKWAVAEQLLALARDAAIVWTGDCASGTPLPYFREMRVVATREITPHTRRITLEGRDLARFAKGGHHVRLLIPPMGRCPKWPVTGSDGRPCWPQCEARPAVRIYTIRRIDVAAGTVDIDMVLHAGGTSPGARFAETARPGDVVGMTGPGGSGIPAGVPLLLAGDETALPAIARILEELPEDGRATAFIEVADRREEQPIACKGRLDLHWLHRNGAAPGTTTLLADAVRGAAVEDDAFVWSGSEFTAFRHIRGNLRKERALSRERHLASTYWRRGLAGEDARKED